MTFDEWLEKYKPVKNHLDENASFDGAMFETYGEELEYVRAQSPDLVWTYSAGDFDLISNGYSFVDRMGYFIASTPYSESEGSTVIDLNEDD